MDRICTYNMTFFYYMSWPELSLYVYEHVNTAVTNPTPANLLHKSKAIYIHTLFVPVNKYFYPSFPSI